MISLLPKKIRAIQFGQNLMLFMSLHILLSIAMGGLKGKMTLLILKRNVNILIMFYMLNRLEERAWAGEIWSPWES